VEDARKRHAAVEKRRALKIKEALNDLRAVMTVRDRAT
jgi:hypothetical protein